MGNIDETLAGRLKTYGAFSDHADIAQMLKKSMWSTPNWDKLDSDMKEALEMVQHKIARILNGDPTYLDNWHDIIGYTRLVEKRLEDAQPPKQDIKEETVKFDMRQFAFYIYSFIDSNPDWIKSIGINSVLEQACDRFISSQKLNIRIVNKGLPTEVRL